MLSNRLTVLIWVMIGNEMVVLRLFETVLCRGAGGLVRQQPGRGSGDGHDLGDLVRTGTTDPLSAGEFQTV